MRNWAPAGNGRNAAHRKENARPYPTHATTCSPNHLTANRGGDDRVHPGSIRPLRASRPRIRVCTRRLPRSPTAAATAPSVTAQAPRGAVGPTARYRYTASTRTRDIVNGSGRGSHRAGSKPARSAQEIRSDRNRKIVTATVRSTWTVRTRRRFTRSARCLRVGAGGGRGARATPRPAARRLLPRAPATGGRRPTDRRTPLDGAPPER